MHKKIVAQQFAKKISTSKQPLEKISKDEAVLVVRLFISSYEKELSNTHSMHEQIAFKEVLTKLSNPVILSILDSIFGMDFIMTHSTKHSPIMKYNFMIEYIIGLVEHTQYPSIRNDLNERITQRNNGAVPYIF